MRHLVAFILRSRMTAVISTVAMALFSLLFPPMSILSSAAVAFVTLRKGAYEGAANILIATLVTGAAEWALYSGLYVSFSYSLLVWVPSWMVAILLRETARLALALEALCLLAGLTVLAIYLVHPEPAEIWLSSLQRIRPALENAFPALDREQISQRLAALSHHATGIAAAGSTLSLALGLLLARLWQAMIFNPGGFRTEFLGLRTHAATAYVSLILIVIVLVGGGLLAEVARNLIMLPAVLYLLVGLAVFHAIFASAKSRKYWLVGIYAALFLIPQISLLVALTGLTDTWLNWRQRGSVGLK
jgi:hypothetical protein